MANVFNFGAGGDGKSDDTEALQHALEEGDGVLHLNKGTYRITRPIVLDLTKQGYGAVIGNGGTSRIIMAGPGPALRVIGDHRGTAQPKSYQPHTWEKERFPTISNIEILGEHAEAVGVELYRTTKTNITNTLIRKCKHGVHLIERNRDFILADSHLLENSEYGVFFDRCNLHQIIIHGNHISWNKKAGIKSLDGDIHNLQITGNDIEYNNNPGIDESPNGEPRGAEIWFEAPEGMISEVTIASNTIQATVQPGGSNIRIHGQDTDFRRGRLIAITGNVIGSQTRAIELKHLQRVTISGNTIYDSDDVSVIAQHCSAIAMGANTFVWRSNDEAPQRDGLLFEDCENCALTGLVTDRMCYGNESRGAAITMRRSTDMAITGCQVIDPWVRGIELEDCGRCRISDNTVVDRREAHRMLQAIRVLGKGKHNLISNNLLGGAKAKLLEAGDGCVIQGNLEIAES